MQVQSLVNGAAHVHFGYKPAGTEKPGGRRPEAQRTSAPEVGQRQVSDNPKHVAAQEDRTVNAPSLARADFEPGRPILALRSTSQRMAPSQSSIRRTVIVNLVMRSVPPEPVPLLPRPWSNSCSNLRPRCPPRCVLWSTRSRSFEGALGHQINQRLGLTVQAVLLSVGSLLARQRIRPLTSGQRHHARELITEAKTALAREDARSRPASSREAPAHHPARSMGMRESRRACLSLAASQPTPAPASPFSP